MAKQISFQQTTQLVLRRRIFDGDGWIVAECCGGYTKSTFLYIAVKSMLFAKSQNIARERHAMQHSKAVIAFSVLYEF